MVDGIHQSTSGRCTKIVTTEKYSRGYYSDTVRYSISFEKQDEDEIYTTPRGSGIRNS